MSDLETIKYKYTSSIPMVTTIKLQDKTKCRLDFLKSEGETYDLLISKLISIVTKEELSTKLKEGYLSLSKEQFEEFKEWDHLES